MYQKINKTVRDELKEMMHQCTEKQCLMFKRMYSNGDPEKPIDDVVNAMPFDKLGWAMGQVQRAIDKNKVDGK